MFFLKVEKLRQQSGPFTRLHEAFYWVLAEFRINWSKNQAPMKLESDPAVKWFLILNYSKKCKSRMPVFLFKISIDSDTNENAYEACLPAPDPVASQLFSSCFLVVLQLASAGSAALRPASLTSHCFSPLYGLHMLSVFSFRTRIISLVQIFCILISILICSLEEVSASETLNHKPW